MTLVTWFEITRLQRSCLGQFIGYYLYLRLIINRNDSLVGHECLMLSLYLLLHYRLQLKEMHFHFLIKLVWILVVWLIWGRNYLPRIDVFDESAMISNLSATVDIFVEVALLGRFDSLSHRWPFYLEHLNCWFRIRNKVHVVNIQVHILSFTIVLLIIRSIRLNKGESSVVLTNIHLRWKFVPSW